MHLVMLKSAAPPSLIYGYFRFTHTHTERDVSGSWHALVVCMGVVHTLEVPFNLAGQNVYRLIRAPIEVRNKHPFLRAFLAA